MLSRAELRDPSLTNADLRGYEAGLIRDAGALRSEAQQLDRQLADALTELRKGGDYYLAEAVSLVISLGGIITFQWLAVVGGLTALYSSVRSRFSNNKDPVRRIMTISLAMRSVRKRAKQITKALTNITYEKRRRSVDPSFGWP
ncbi:MAG TPA: hypothetical protein VFP12_07170 [Allosphingosinicella sp.]|nr:hypothetical protein [Allosphingosinicella sp.]